MKWIGVTCALTMGIAVLSLFAPAIASDQCESFGFKGILLLSDISDVQRNPKFSCRKVSSPLADQICHPKPGKIETMGGAPIGSVTLCYFGGKLHTIDVMFEEVVFSQIIQALMDKYGEIAPVTEKVQNRMGAVFENHIFSWRKDGQTMEARRYTTNLDSSGVRIYTDFAVQEFTRRNDSNVKRHAKDL